MIRRWHIVISAAIALWVTSAATALHAADTSPPAAQPASQPATWAHFDMIIDLQNLPKRYTCNDLWYRFRDVLWGIGARYITELLTYDCASSPGAEARSPRLHLAFFLPQAAQGALASQTKLRATPTTVRFGPGQPQSFDASDCELLRQIKDTLLSQLPVEIASADLACTTAQGRQPRFGVSVRTLVPPAGVGSVATTG